MKMKWWYCMMLFFAGFGLGAMLLFIKRPPPPGPPLSPDEQAYAKAVKWYGGEV